MIQGQSAPRKGGGTDNRQQQPPAASTLRGCLSSVSAVPCSCHKCPWISASGIQTAHNSHLNPPSASVRSCVMSDPSRNAQHTLHHHHQHQSPTDSFLAAPSNRTELSLVRPFWTTAALSTPSDSHLDQEAHLDWSETRSCANPDRPDKEGLETPVSVCSINQLGPSSSFLHHYHLLHHHHQQPMLSCLTPGHTLHDEAPSCPSSRLLL